MNETVPKKMVSRKVAKGLGIICVALTISLAFFVIADTSTINSLQSQVKDLKDTVNLSKTSDWGQNFTVTLTDNRPFDLVQWKSVDDAGYLIIGASSTSNDAWLEVDYYISLPQPHPKTGFMYNPVVNISSYPTWNAFAILPTDNYNPFYQYVNVGLWNTTESANVTLSITYYY